VTRAASRRPAARRRRSIRVRDLRWNDFGALVRSYYRLYDERDAGQYHGITLRGEKPSLAQEVDWFASLYRRQLTGDVVSVVGEVRGQVVGSCTIGRVGPAPDAEDGHVGLLGILVERDHRGRGVGTALLRAALARARRKFQVVRLGVHSNNPDAKRLYERFGFRTVGRYPKATRRRGVVEDEDLMALVFRPRGGARAKR
jgi:RimJ/RimL family protein N-acetyltransferase